MAGRKKANPNTSDPTVRTCLTKVARRQLDAAGVLADRLEELGHPLAAAVREAWDLYQHNRAYWTGEGYGRKARRVSRVERVARCGWWLRERVRRAFGKTWKTVSLKDFM